MSEQFQSKQSIREDITVQTEVEKVLGVPIGKRETPLWREALVIPLPKEGKNHDYANSYRPIALTSCICKTVERMVNERLIFHLDKNTILTKIQCGFRNDKSTVDQLVRLETYVRDAFACNEHCRRRIL